MTSIVITGATGTVGSAVLTTALASHAISHVTVLARSPPKVPPNPKLETILLPSDAYPHGFDEISPQLIEHLRKNGTSGVVWALGISQTQVSKDEYVKITRDYTLAASKMFGTLGTPTQPFRFVFVSGMGATQAEDAWTTFGNVKGNTEKQLVEQENASGGTFKAAIVRPGAVIPAQDHVHNLSLATRLLVQGIRRLMPSSAITSTQIAHVAVDLAAGKSPDAWTARDPKEYWIDNKGLLKLAKAYDAEMSQ